MTLDDFGTKTEAYMFKMQVIVKKTLQLNSTRVGMSKAEYLINLIIADNPYLKDKYTEALVSDKQLKIEIELKEKISELIYLNKQNEISHNSKLLEIEKELRDLRKSLKNIISKL